MAGLQSSNPVFERSPSLKKGAAWPTPGDVEDIYRTPQRLTIDDVVVKTGILLAVLVAAGAVAWVGDAPAGLVALAGIVGFVLALVNMFKREVVPALVVAYAAF